MSITKPTLSLSPEAARRRPVTSATMEILGQAARERGGQHLLKVRLGLARGSRLLALHLPTQPAQRALAALVHNATLLGIDVVAFEVDRITLLGGTGREEIEQALRAVNACVVLESGSGDVGSALEHWLCDHLGSLPTALLRFDAAALVMAPMSTEGVGLGSLDRGDHHDLDLWLHARLERAQHIELEDAAGTRLSLELTRGACSAGARQVGPHLWRFPSTPVSATVHAVDGKLVGPRVFMPDGSPDGHAPLRSFQFRDGALRAVEGPFGAIWMREAMQLVPGLFATRVAFGTCQRDPSANGNAPADDDGRPTAFERPGCIITLLDPRLGLTDRGDTSYRGISFCAASASLSVRVDGTPVLRDGGYTDAVRRLASAPRSPRDTR